MLNKALFLHLLLASLYLKTYAHQSDTLKLYYKINEKTIQRHSTLIDSFLLVPYTCITQAYVIGYADFIGSVDYNLHLSKERAQLISALLKQKLNDISIDTEWKGEIPFSGTVSASGNPYDRRVEIIAKREAISNPVTTKVEQTNKSQPTPAAIPGNDAITSLANLKVGTSISIQELNFISTRHVLLPESLSYLEILLNTLKNNPSLCIQLIGHIAGKPVSGDGYDSDTKERHLSLNRAKFIYDYLVKNGIAASRMKYSGVGNSQPKVYPERNAEDMAKNRRVEIVVTANFSVK